MRRGPSVAGSSVLSQSTLVTTIRTTKRGSVQEGVMTNDQLMITDESLDGEAEESMIQQLKQ